MSEKKVTILNNLVVMNERDKEDSSIYFKERISNDTNEKSGNFGSINEAQNDSKQQLSSRNDGAFRIKNQFNIPGTQNRKGLQMEEFDRSIGHVVHAQK